MFVQSYEEFEKKRELSEVWFFYWSFETKTAIFNFDNPAEKFFAKHGNCSFKVLKNLKKKELPKVWFFDWPYETKTATFNFDIPAEIFSAEHGNCSFEVLKNLKKKENFQRFDFLKDLMRRKLHFSILISLSKPFSSSTVNVRSKFWRIWKKRFFKCLIFLINLMRRRLQFSILIPLPKTFSPSTVNVRSKFRRVWKKRDFSEVWFFDWSFETKTAIFNFDTPAKNFLAKHSKCSFKVPKSLKKKRLFRSLVFWLILWHEDFNFQFWYPWRNVVRQAR